MRTGHDNEAINKRRTLCALDHRHEAIVPEEPALSIRPRQAAAQKQSGSRRRVTAAGQVQPGRDNSSAYLDADYKRVRLTAHREHSSLPWIRRDANLFFFFSFFSLFNDTSAAIG